MSSYFNKFSKLIKSSINISNIKKDLTKVNNYINENKEVKKIKEYTNENILNKDNLMKNINNTYDKLKNNLEKPENKKSEEKANNFYYEKHYHHYYEKEKEEKKDENINNSWFNYFKGKIFKDKKKETFFENTFKKKFFIQACVLISLFAFFLSFGKQAAKEVFKEKKITQKLEDNK